MSQNGKSDGNGSAREKIAEIAIVQEGVCWFDNTALFYYPDFPAVFP